MKIDTGEDTCFYIRFVYVLISHLLFPKTILYNSPCFPKYSVTIFQKSLDLIWKLELIEKMFNVRSQG